jgi:hypothetical protein
MPPDHHLRGDSGVPYLGHASAGNSSEAAHTPSWRVLVDEACGPHMRLIRRALVRQPLRPVQLESLGPGLLSACAGGSVLLVDDSHTSDGTLHERLALIRRSAFAAPLRVFICSRTRGNSREDAPAFRRAGADEVVPADSPHGERLLRQAVDRCRAIHCPADTLVTLAMALGPDEASEAIRGAVRYPFAVTAAVHARRYGRPLQTLNRVLRSRDDISLGRACRWGSVECLATSRADSAIRAEQRAALVSYASAKVAATARRLCEHDERLLRWLAQRGIPSMLRSQGHGAI